MNIILILTDDLDSRIASRFPGIPQMLGADGGEGVSFSESYVVNPLCCPSRCSLLTGLNTHNHGVLANNAPSGSVSRYRELGHEALDIGASMQGAGFKTIYIGKYLNGYMGGYEPPGWDRWHGFVGGYGQTPYRFNENGTITSYDPDKYHDTYIMRDFATRAIYRNTLPLFMVLSFNAPHSPAPAAPEDKGKFADETAPRGNSFAESDVSDKPLYVRREAPLTPDERDALDKEWRKKLRSMASVERSIQDIIQALEETGKLEDTYLLFTSDNGYHFGEHDLASGKGTPYEEAIRAPLHVRGPGIPKGEVRDEFVLNIDLAPTFAEWGGAELLMPPDGQPLFGEQRDSFLVEHYQDVPGAGNSYIPGFKTLHTKAHVYIEYATGEIELYDLRVDPYEMQSIHGEADPDLLASLRAELTTLSTSSV